MQDFFFKQIIGKLAGKLDGYKTIIGGVGLILSGVVGIIGNMYPDSGLPQPSSEVIMSQFSLGFVALGLGGKVEKLTKKTGEQPAKES